MTTLSVFAIALVASLLLTIVARSMAVRFRVVDEPDGGRKLQARPVPLWGGVAVFLSLTIGVLVATQTPGIASPALWHLSALLLASAGCVFLLGFVDDYVDLNGRLKLVLQIISVVPIIATGHWFERALLFNFQIELGYWGIPLMVLWLVGCINAMNLLDGMDGNASVIGLVACGAIAIIAGRHGHDHVAVIAVIMAGSLLGFLAFNRPPACIYLGDSGSTVIGLVVGLLCIEGANMGPGELRIAAPIAIMTLPILDTTLAIVRRSLTGRRFDSGDRGHIHHRLQERGFNTWQALAIVTGLCLATALAAVAASFTECEPLAWITSLVLIVALTHLRFFGHHELALAARHAVRLAGQVSERIWVLVHPTLRTMDKALPSLSFDEAWQLLTAELSQWPATDLDLYLRHGDQVQALRSWTNPATELPSGYHWRLSLVLGPCDATQCELLVNGQDSLTSHPRYLNHMGALVRIFGRYWASPSGMATILQLRIFDPQQPTTPATREQRRAA